MGPRLFWILVLWAVGFCGPQGAGAEQIALFSPPESDRRRAALLRELSAPLQAALARDFRLVEAQVVERAVRQGDFAAEDGIRLGTDLGVPFVVGLRLGATAYHLEGQLVEVETGRLLPAQQVEAQDHEIFDQVEVLGGRLGQQLARAKGRGQTVAVLEFSDGSGGQHQSFVRGIADMLNTQLAQMPGVHPMARSAVDGAVQRFGPVGLESADGKALVPMGRWLGADALVLGRFAPRVQLEIELWDIARGAVVWRDGLTVSAGMALETVEGWGRHLTGELARYRHDKKKVAVLDFANYAAERYDSFVRSMSDMLMTSMGRADNLVLIERAQIERAMGNFALEMSGPIDGAKAVEIGQWLGADGVVLGSFTQFGAQFRLDARLIDARTGELLAAQDARGLEDEVMVLVDRLGGRLVDRFDAGAQAGVGVLRVRFMVTKTEMGERPVYHHIAKLYIDGRYVGETEPVERAEVWVTLAERRLPAGSHRVELRHGYLSEGVWDGEMAQQPRVFLVDVEAEGTTTIQYSFEVGWFGDRYLYEHPWRGVPR